MSTILKNNLESRINAFITNNANSNKVERYIAMYIDKNNEVLYASAPLYRLYFGDEERDFIFNLVPGITKQSITELVNKIEDINAAWQIVSDPFNLLMTNYIRCATIKKKENFKYSCIMYLTLSLYSSLHFKYYKYLPNENAMNYAINNNMSNKFLIKKYGVLYKALEHIAIKNHETYEADLIKGEDLNIKDYIMNLRTRLNNFMKTITDEYMKALKEKKYLNTEEDSNDEENYRQTTNISVQMESLIVKCSNKFFSNEINQKFVRSSAKYANVHPATLGAALDDIKENETENVNKLIGNILRVYLNNKNNTFESIASNRFISYCLQIYSKSNSKDPDILSLKKLLDYFLVNHCNRYSETEREATRGSYRKALYVYFLMHINECAVKK